MMNTDTFNAIVLPLQNKLFRFAVSILKNKTDSEDALQEVLVKLWEQKNSLSKYNNIEAFAMQMIKNKCIDKLRKVKQTDEVNDDIMGAGMVNPYKQAELKDTVNLAYSLIEQLPYMQQMIIRLRDVEEYELDEIAEIMEISSSAVRTNLSRARQTIRQQLINME